MADKEETTKMLAGKLFRIIPIGFLQTISCGYPSFQRIFDYLQNKIINYEGLDEYPIGTVPISKKWYIAAEGVLYLDSTTSDTYNYSITIIMLGSQQPECPGICNANPVKYCFETCPDNTQNPCVMAMKLTKNDDAVDVDVPNDIIDAAMSTLPTTTVTPTVMPTVTPTVTPTVMPTVTPTVTPTVMPTVCNTNQYKLPIIGCTSKTYTHIGIVGTVIIAAYLYKKSKKD